MTYDVVVDGKTHQLDLKHGEKTWLCKIDGQEIEVDAALTARDVLSILVGGKAYEIKRERSLQGELHMVIGSARYAVDVQDPRSLRTRRGFRPGSPGSSGWSRCRRRFRFPPDGNSLIDKARRIPLP